MALGDFQDLRFPWTATAAPPPLPDHLIQGPCLIEFFSIDDSDPENITFTKIDIGDPKKKS